MKTLRKSRMGKTTLVLTLALLLLAACADPAGTVQKGDLMAGCGQRGG